MTRRPEGNQKAAPAQRVMAKTAGSLPFVAADSRSRCSENGHRFQLGTNNAADLSWENLAAWVTRAQMERMEVWNKTIVNDNIPQECHLRLILLQMLNDALLGTISAALTIVRWIPDFQS